MKIGKEISISPISVEFLLVIARPTNISAIVRATVSAISIFDNWLDLIKVAKSLYIKPEIQAKIRTPRPEITEEMPSEVGIEILAYIFSLRV